MSVLIPNDNVFNYVLHGIEQCVYGTVVNEYYSHTLRQHFMNKDVEKESKRLVESWMKLNDLSFCVKYNEEVDTKIKLVRKTLHKPMQPHQFLMYLACINYNIELDTIEDMRPITEQEKMDYEILRNTENDIAHSICKASPEWKSSTWSN